MSSKIDLMFTMGSCKKLHSDSTRRRMTEMRLAMRVKDGEVPRTLVSLLPSFIYVISVTVSIG